jgi:hypothetical protein
VIPASDMQGTLLLGRDPAVACDGGVQVSAGVAPDEFTYAAILNACQRAEEADLAFEVFGYAPGAPAIGRFPRKHPPWLAASPPHKRKENVHRMMLLCGTHAL